MMQDIVADSGIAFSGTGTNRTMTIATMTNNTGTAIITIILSDGLTFDLKNIYVDVQRPSAQPSRLSFISPLMWFDTTPSFVFQITGDTNATIVSERSSDLRTWEAFSTNTLLGLGVTGVRDAEVIKPPYRYYRAHVMDDSAPSPAIFIDSFDRPDAVETGNGWSNLVGSDGYSHLALRDGKAVLETRDGSNGAAGILRPMTGNLPLEIAATFTHASGNTCYSNRFDVDVGIRNFGKRTAGYRINIVRSDSATRDSSITLFDGDQQLQRIPVSIQLASPVRVSVRFNPDGSIVGVVSGNDGNSEFSFPAHLIISSGTNACLFISGPDTRCSNLIFPTVDDVMIKSYSP